jgi:hypothetical protein
MGYVATCRAEEAEYCPVESPPTVHQGTTLIENSSREGAGNPLISVPAVPMAGAIVTARGAGLRVASGALAATTDASGRYALALPPAVTGITQVLTARHRDHAAPIRATNISGTIGGVPARADFVAPRDVADQSAPLRLSVSHTPESPAVWVGDDAPDATEVALIEVRASGASQPPTLTVAAVRSLVEGVDANEVVLAPVDEGTVERRQYRLTSRHAVRVELRARADNGTSPVTAQHVLYVGEGPVGPEDMLEDPADTTPPRLVSSSPAHNARAVSTNVDFELRFSRAVHAQILDRASDFVVRRATGGDVVAPATGVAATSVARSADRHSLTVRFIGLQTNTRYRLSVGPSIRSLTGVPYDADPSTRATDYTEIAFETAAEASVVLDMGGAQTSALLAGATIHAGYAYVVDRGFWIWAATPWAASASTTSRTRYTPRCSP